MKIPQSKEEREFDGSYNLLRLSPTRSIEAAYKEFEIAGKLRNGALEADLARVKRELEVTRH